MLFVVSLSGSFRYQFKRYIFCLLIIIVTFNDAESNTGHSCNKKEINIPFLENIVIDGNSKDWNNKGFFVKLFSDQYGKHVLSDDFSANLKIGWNKKGLLLLITVVDDSVVESNNRRSLYTHDCVEIFMADSVGGKNLIQFILTPGISTEYPELRIQTEDFRSSRTLVDKEIKIYAAKKKLHKGYLIEALLPFENISLSPDGLKEPGVQIYVNDVDQNQESRYRMQWNPHIKYECTQSLYPLRLSGEAGTPLKRSSSAYIVDDDTLHLIISGDRMYNRNLIEVKNHDSIMFAGKMVKEGNISVLRIVLPLTDAWNISQKPSIFINGIFQDEIDLNTIPHEYNMNKRLNRFENDIRVFEEDDKKNPPVKNAVLFIGDSDIRFWKTLADDMIGLDVINRGFGGSRTGDLLFFFDRIVLPYKPQSIVINCGGNDINIGIPDDEIIKNIKMFVEKVHQTLPETTIFLLSEKPSPVNPAGWMKKKELSNKFMRLTGEYNYTEFIDIFDLLHNETGELNGDYFRNDLAHLNAKGYKIWSVYIKKQLMESRF